MMVQACHSLVDFLDNYIKPRGLTHLSQSSFYTTYIDTRVIGQNVLVL